MSYHTLLVACCVLCVVAAALAAIIAYGQARKLARARDSLLWLTPLMNAISTFPDPLLPVEMKFDWTPQYVGKADWVGTFPVAPEFSR